MKIKLIFYNHEELFKNINVDNVSELESMLNETIPTWVSLMTPLGVKYSRKKIDLLELEL